MNVSRTANALAASASARACAATRHCQAAAPAMPMGTKRSRVSDSQHRPLFSCGLPLGRKKARVGRPRFAFLLGATCFGKSAKTLCLGNPNRISGTFLGVPGALPFYERLLACSTLNLGHPSALVQKLDDSIPLGAVPTSPRSISALDPGAAALSCGSRQNRLRVSAECIRLTSQRTPNHTVTDSAIATRRACQRSCASSGLEPRVRCRSSCPPLSAPVCKRCDKRHALDTERINQRAQPRLSAYHWDKVDKAPRPTDCDALGVDVRQCTKHLLHYAFTVRVQRDVPHHLVRMVVQQPW